MSVVHSIKLHSISRRYGWQWIFRNFSKQLNFGHTYAICGKNGSGKSTLLRLLSSMESPDEGKITFTVNKQNKDHLSSHFSFSAPYMEVPDQLTLSELLDFHRAFKKMSKSSNDILNEIKLAKNRNKYFQPFHQDKNKKSSSH